jgi:O-antigen/teichoic acid export membrane protein
MLDRGRPDEAFGDACAVPVAKSRLADRGAFLKMLSGGVAVQAMISGSNFFVGLVLVRRTPDAQYGYYVLIVTIVLLSTVLQGAFIQPPMLSLFNRTDSAGKADLIGSLMKDQNRLLPYVLVITGLVALGMRLAGILTPSLIMILLAGTAAVVAALRREFLRMTLFAYRRPNEVLKSDGVYCVILVTGAILATLSPLSAVVATLSMSVAALLGGSLLSRALWRHEPWNRNAAPGMLRNIAPEGAWSAFGGGVHWLFAQGYNYLIAGTLDVTAVAAVAATRLLVMPVGLLSTGIGTLMLPTVSQWTQYHSATKVLRRLALFATGLACLASLYLVAMWLASDWIFGQVLHKNFADRHLLLLLWSAVALVAVFRDQLLYFLIARARFRVSSMITLSSAIISFIVSISSMQRYGVLGAMFGLLAAEVCNAAGVVIYSIRELGGRKFDDLPAKPSTSP